MRPAPARCATALLAVLASALAGGCEGEQPRRWSPADPKTADEDWDDDGLTNSEERAAGTAPDEADTDGDEDPDGADCAPLDPRVHSAAPELCNGKDDNCDGRTDEGCSCLPGDRSPCYPGPPEARGVGACNEGEQTCTSDGDWSECRGAGLPATEICGNALDDDCDGQTDSEDPDIVPPAANRTEGVCAGTTKRCLGAGVWGEPDYATLLPDYEIQEASCDGLDNDCDGLTDSDDPDLRPPAASLATGACQGAVKICTGLEGWADPPFADLAGWQAAETECDGQDNDCDGLTDSADPDLTAPEANETRGVCAVARQRCVGDRGWEEPDYRTIESFELAETLCDGLDNDCDGLTDQDDPDVSPPPADLVAGVCEGATKACAGADDWAEPDYAAHHEAWEPSEATCDGLDNDCDGLIDTDDPDLIAPPARLSVGVCADQVLHCLGAEGWDEPDFLAVGGYQLEETRCDGLDNDCDGLIDELDSLEGPFLAALQDGVCQGAVQVCEGRWREPDVLELTHHAPTYEEEEVTCDETDNDCDGSIDEATDLNTDPEHCGSCDAACEIANATPGCRGGRCAVGECDEGFHDVNRDPTDGCEYECIPSNPPAERCDGVDNDCDGLTDEDLFPPSCFIDGECVPVGTPDPDNACLACRPEVDTQSLTALDGQPCDDDDPTTPLDVCLLGQCRGGGLLADNISTSCWGPDEQEILCPLPGEPGFGQDAQYVGPRPRFDTSEDGLIIDENTGLIWQEPPAEERMTQAEGIAFCESLDHAGHTDWRLPNIRELSSLAQTGFPGEDGYFWSSTSRANGDRQLRWSLSVRRDGYVYMNACSPDRESDIRCVRGHQMLDAGTSLSALGDGTVRDPATALEWQELAPEEPMSWHEALAYCEALELGGHSDWRLPSFRQLESIIDYTGESGTSPSLLEGGNDSFWHSWRCGAARFAAGDEFSCSASGIRQTPQYGSSCESQLRARCVRAEEPSVARPCEEPGICCNGVAAQADGQPCAVDDACRPGSRCWAGACIAPRCRLGEELALEPDPPMDGGADGSQTEARALIDGANIVVTWRDQRFSPVRRPVQARVTLADLTPLDDGGQFDLPAFPYPQDSGRPVASTAGGGAALHVDFIVPDEHGRAEELRCVRVDTITGDAGLPVSSQWWDRDQGPIDPYPLDLVMIPGGDRAVFFWVEHPAIEFESYFGIVRATLVDAHTCRPVFGREAVEVGRGFDGWAWNRDDGDYAGRFDVALCGDEFVAVWAREDGGGATDAAHVPADLRRIGATFSLPHVKSFKLSVACDATHAHFTWAEGRALRTLSVAQADWRGWGQEVTDLGSVDASLWGVDVAVHEGVRLVVYSAGGDLFGFRVSPAGLRLDEAAFVIGDGPGTRPRLTSLEEGWLVAWDALETQQDVRIARVRPDGTSPDGGGLLVSTGTAGQVTPRLTPRLNGWLVAWPKRAGDRASFGYQFLDAQGEPEAAQGEVPVPIGRYAPALRNAGCSELGCLLAGTGQLEGMEDRGVIAAFVDLAGVRDEAIPEVRPIVIGQYVVPRAVASDGSGFLVSWTEYLPDRTRLVGVSILGENGAVEVGEIELSSNEDAQSGSVGVVGAWFSDGAYQVHWFSRHAGEDGSDESRLHRAAISPAGELQRPAETYFATPGRIYPNEAQVIPSGDRLLVALAGNGWVLGPDDQLVLDDPLNLSPGRMDHVLASAGVGWHELNVARYGAPTLALRRISCEGHLEDGSLYSPAIDLTPEQPASGGGGTRYAPRVAARTDGPTMVAYSRWVPDLLARRLFTRLVDCRP